MSIFIEQFMMREPADDVTVSHQWVSRISPAKIHRHRAKAKVDKSTIVSCGSSVNDKSIEIMLSCSRFVNSSRLLRSSQFRNPSLHGRWKCFASITRNYFGKSTLIESSYFKALGGISKHLIVTRSTATNTTPAVAQKWIGRWLFGCSGMVFGAVVLGGITRITESGLSMVHWHMFKEIPPFTNSEWEMEFEKYQNSPEFKYKHQHFTLEDFKWIWYMEYIHRMWGRAIGAVFLLPATYFFYKKWFTKAMKVRVVIFGTLIGVQGLLGWYMVKSGLQENDSDHYVPRVSPSRMALHLGAAFVLYTLFLWSAFSHTLPPQTFEVTPKLRTLWKLAHVTKGIAFCGVISGAFVAGLNAGLVYNSFPKMGDKWIPEDIMALEPKRRNFTENATTVQFNHRIFGISTLALVSSLWLYSRKVVLPPRARTAVNCVFAMGMIQVGMGITTLLLYVPKTLAVMHQAGAMGVISFLLWLTHELKMVIRVPKV